MYFNIQLLVQDYDFSLLGEVKDFFIMRMFKNSCHVQILVSAKN